MTRIVAVLVFLFLGLFSASAQEETLVSGDLESGGYGGPSVVFGSVNGELGVLVGGYGGWLVNHTFMLGLGGYGEVSGVEADQSAVDAYSPLGKPLYLNFGYGGAVMEIVIAPSRLVHVVAHALIGAGAVNYRESFNEDTWDFGDSYYLPGSDTFFVVEPGANVELNVTTWMRFDAGVSYRYVTGVNRLIGLRNADLAGPSANVTLKFGSF